MKKGQTGGAYDGIDGASIFEIAEVLGCSHQRASQVLKAAMEKFRRGMLARGYRCEDFLEKIAAKKSPPA